MSRVQPARLVLVQRGLTIRDAAVGTDYSPHWVSRVLRGLDRPSRRFRRALAEWLDLPEQVLFHDDSPGAGCSMTPEELRAWVRDSRARQGLGPTITDPTAQDQLAAMAADTLTRHNGDGADQANDKRPAASTSTARSRTRRKDPA